VFFLVPIAGVALQAVVPFRFRLPPFRRLRINSLLGLLLFLFFSNVGLFTRELHRLVSCHRIRARGRPMPVAFCLTKRAIAEQNPDADEVRLDGWVFRTLVSFLQLPCIPTT